MTGSSAYRDGSLAKGTQNRNRKFSGTKIAIVIVILRGSIPQCFLSNTGLKLLYKFSMSPFRTLASAHASNENIS